MASILYPSSIGLFGIFNECFERLVSRTVILSIEHLLDGIYADLKQLASIDAIGSSFLYRADGAGGAGGSGGSGGSGGPGGPGGTSGGSGGAPVGSDMWIYR